MAEFATVKNNTKYSVRDSANHVNRPQGHHVGEDSPLLPLGQPTKRYSDLLSRSERRPFVDGARTSIAGLNDTSAQNLLQRMEKTAYELSLNVSRDATRAPYWSHGIGVTSDYYYVFVNDTANATNYSDPLTNVTVTVPPGLPSGYTLPHVILAAIFVTLLMIVIVVGNALVIAAIAKDRNLKQVQNWFIASLAVSDLCVGALIMPFSLANELMGYWYFGKIMCELWLAVDVLLCTASILNLCLISLDRYWSITKAIAYVRQRTRNRVMVMIGTVWALSAIICFPPLVGWKRPQRVENGYPRCELSEDIGYIIYSTMGSFYIPLGVLIVVYFKIYLAIRQRARRNLKLKQQKKALKEPPTNTNTKSMSTTTTSFTHPANNVAKVNQDEFDDLSSDDCTPTNRGSDEHQGSGEHPESETPASLPSVNNIKLHTIDEHHKLLSDTEVTDSACESPMIQKSSNQNAVSVPVSDTDGTTSDCSFSQNKFNGYRQTNKEAPEENLKPLLEDSVAESDSQLKDNGQAHKSEKNIPENNDKSVKDKVKDKESKLKTFISPNSIRRMSAHVRLHKQSTRTSLSKKPIDDLERQKRNLAKARERRATIVLGVVMGTFIVCWFPFFSTYVISQLAHLEVPGQVFAVFFWAGYCNSALNPVIYTIFNQEFRKAFQKILCGRKS